MQTVGIKDLKNSLSKHLASVKKGEDIIITERGRPFARIISEKSDKLSLYEALKPLILKDIIVMPTRKIEKHIQTPDALPGKSISDMIIEDRR